MKGILFLILTVLFAISSCKIQEPKTIDLSGTWQFQMDPDDKGEQEKWFNQDLQESVSLPSSMAENGKGYDITLNTKWTGVIRGGTWYEKPYIAPYVDTTNIKFPYWLQPVKKYTGAAWYIKKVTVPKDFKNKTITLLLERPHWESIVWINGKKAGTQNSLAVPHIFDVTSFLQTGENTIAIRIDNRLDEVNPGVDSHSVADHTQSNWNGIVGEICLEARGKITIGNMKIIPDVKTKTAEINATINNTFTTDKTGKITISALLKNTNNKTGSETFILQLKPGENVVKLNYKLGEDALLWDEFNPNVYTLSLSLQAGKETDSRSVDFGLREVHVEGKRFVVNGRPIFLRGTLECAIFPKTGYPPTDLQSWRKVFNTVKEYGLNHVRFHSWCPPEAAFIVADELGVYIQVECSTWPTWPNGDLGLGDGLPIDQYVWDESKRIVNAHGNHPSFIMMAHGNEAAGKNREKFLAEFVNYWKKEDSRRVYVGASGYPSIPESDYYNAHTYNHKRVRIQGWGDELKSIINSKPPRSDYNWDEALKGLDVPMISHEIGQWCAYPNFKEIPKYTGVLKAKNFELFQESLKDHHMANLANSFLLASGKLQALCYKADIEAALRTKGFGGFQLLDLHDFPGQGTALVGVLDVFWDNKGYITAEEYKRFCNVTVPLAKLKKHVFVEGDTLIADVEVAHFGEKPISNAESNWKITAGNNTIANGSFNKRDIPIDNCIALGAINYQFQHLEKAQKMVVEVSIGEYSNSWDIWVYPNTKVESTNNIKVVEALDAATMKYLQNGGKVLLSLGKGKVAPEMGGDVGVGFSSIFWNTAWTQGQKPHTLGILCNPKHPALELFPTEYHSNWQWWDAMSHCDAIQLDSFSTELKPIVRIIDNWFTNRRLALLFEAKVGEGSILVSGVDLINELENRPEARQLLSSLKNYMEGADFDPKVAISEKQTNKILIK